MINPDQADLQLLRQKAVDGTLTLEEVKKAISYIRINRENVQHSKAGKKKSTPTINTDALLDELGDL